MDVKESCCCCLTSWAHAQSYAYFSNMQTVNFNVVFSVSPLDVVKLMMMNACLQSTPGAANLERVMSCEKLPLLASIIHVCNIEHAILFTEVCAVNCNINDDLPCKNFLVHVI